MPGASGKVPSRPRRNVMTQTDVFEIPSRKRTRLCISAFDLGITLFDAADTYGNGLSEELIAKAFPNQR
jgi:aryl-alcohol dehydrogenase-like predicted oxidoreductase